MDSSKLQNILIDLTTGNEDKITEILNLLTSNISSNQSNEISENMRNLKSYFSNSISNRYNVSNLKIVENIGAREYFGLSGFQNLEEILNKNSYDVQKTITDLQNFIHKRTEYVNLLKTTSDNLDKLGISPHYYNDDTFEVGLIMSEEFTNNKIVNITKELNHWDKVFKTLKELTSGSAEDTEINLVNNGSLEFFINNGPQIAACLAVILERVIKLYGNIIEIRVAKEKLKELGISTGEQKAIEKQEKDVLNKGIDSITADIIKEFATKEIDSGRINELKIAVKGHISYVAKCIDNGMLIEINPPEIHAPKEANENDTDEKRKEIERLKAGYNKTLSQIEIVQKSMDAAKSIGKTGVEILKYLTDGEDSKEE